MQHLTVAVFAQDSRINVCRADAEMCGEQRAEPRGVEDGAGPDHSFRHNSTPPCDCGDNLGHHVNWIGRHQKIGSGAAANTAGTISAKISALRESRSSRLSHGL